MRELIRITTRKAIDLDKIESIEEGDLNFLHLYMISGQIHTLSFKTVEDRDSWLKKYNISISD